MPHPIPDHQVIPRSLKFLSRRQIQRRPTTLRQFSKLIGLGSDRLTGLLEQNRIEYVLVPHGKKWRQGNVEIILIKLPDNLAEDLIISNEEIYASYKEMFIGEVKPMEPVEYFDVPEGSPGDELTPEEMVDPYFRFRLSEQKFLQMRDGLIEYEELLRIALGKGYTYNAIYRATGGPKMRYVLPSPVWRPYMVGAKKYFDKEVLKHLQESDKTYKSPARARMRRKRRQIRMEEVQDPMLLKSRKELWSAQKVEKVVDYQIR